VNLKFKTKREKEHYVKWKQKILSFIRIEDDDYLESEVKHMYGSFERKIHQKDNRDIKN